MKKTNEELYELASHGTEQERIKLAKDGYCLGVLFTDVSPHVRKEVAKQDMYNEELATDSGVFVRRVVASNGFKPHLFLKDTSWLVRREVAKLGRYLDILAEDKSSRVRLEVLRRGYIHPSFTTDTSTTLRAMVAQKGYGADVLYKDPDAHIRFEVALHGKYLEELAKDEDRTVSRMAKRLLGAKVEVVARDFGTYQGNVYLYMWDNRYEIHSGCYKAMSLKEWQEKANTKVGEYASSVVSERITEHLHRFYKTEARSLLLGIVAED